MEITLTRELNGINMSHNELKQLRFRSDVISKIIDTVNKRVNNGEISPTDES